MYLSRQNAVPMVPAVGRMGRHQSGFDTQSFATPTSNGHGVNNGRPKIHARLSCHQHRLRVRALLSQVDPANWVFCGDTMLSMSDRARDWPNFVAHFSHFVRWQIRRFPDVVIDACLPEDSLSLISSQLDQRVLRFQPHAVFIMCGPEEASAGMAGLQSFEDALLSILWELLEEGITPIVHTPPSSLDSGDALFDSLVYVEAIRSITAELDVPLVDHWDFWETTSAENGCIRKWYEPDTSLPGKLGHERMSELMLQKLGLTVKKLAVSSR